MYRLSIINVVSDFDYQVESLSIIDVVNLSRVIGDKSSFEVLDKIILLLSDLKKPFRIRIILIRNKTAGRKWRKFRQLAQINRNEIWFHNSGIPLCNPRNSFFSFIGLIISYVGRHWRRLILLSEINSELIESLRGYSSTFSIVKIIYELVDDSILTGVSLVIQLYIGETITWSTISFVTSGLVIWHAWKRNTRYVRSIA